MHDAVHLLFSSQQQLLARLLHLSRLDTDFILLTGPESAGKSELVSRLLEETTLMLPTLLDAGALASHAHFREMLLGRWFPEAVFNADDTLSDTMVRLLPASLHKRLLVVDNAEWLSDVLLQELVQLYLTLPAPIRPFMVLLGSTDWASQLCHQLEDTMRSRVFKVEVPPLAVVDKQEAWQTPGHPSSSATSYDIQPSDDETDTMEPQMKVQDYRQLLESKWVKILLTALILVVVLIIIVRLLGEVDRPAPKLVQPFEQQDELTLPPPLPAAAPTAEVPAVSDDSLVREWPVEPLPETPAINPRVAETSDDSDRERVVIEDKVVSQLMQRETDSQPAVAAAPAQAGTGSLTPLSVLMQKPATRYTLQLMAGRNRAVLEKLASRHTLTPAWVYPRTIKGQPWFVLVFGDFDSPKQARGAIGVLSAELQAAKPWPKPFAQVQKEAKP